MQTAGSGPVSPSTTMLATLPVTANGHPGNLGSMQFARLAGAADDPVTVASGDGRTGSLPGCVLVIPATGRDHWGEGDTENA